ncbi:VOC family protein [Comamonas sp. GB3 AK4-5]|uniref:VOC family protein n=1 Tax=Comamonas sp. GB3 AK4-5 TaxID=3231487 RepID=UPI00351F33C0
MNITTIHHVHFHFPPQSREEVRFFYATVLGAQERHSPERKQLLQFELGQQLLCFTPHSQAPRHGAAQHVAFNVQDIDDLKHRLHAFDQVFIANHSALQTQQVYVKDPAGNQLEFLEYPA